jgi:mannan endo-1,4-beta-mannosidase
MKLEEPIFRHPALQFATIHIYEQGTIDHPRNTVDPAIGMGRIVRHALAEIHDGRPFLDTEHGPIHAYKDRKRPLSEAFDDEYFRHTQWAHLAAGGAGGGMRWPNRTPHVLTSGMRRARRRWQRSCR